jgi:hypothetical protein
MFFQELLFVLGDGNAFPFNKIVVDNHRRTLGAEPPFLPGFVAQRKRFGSYPFHKGFDFHITVKENLVQKIVVRVGHDQGPVLVGKAQGGTKDPKQGRPGRFKPDRQDHIVDMSQSVHVPKAGTYCHQKHKKTPKELTTGFFLKARPSNFFKLLIEAVPKPGWLLFQNPVGFGTASIYTFLVEAVSGNEV